jgi:hypothetical protein
LLEPEACPLIHPRGGVLHGVAERPDDATERDREALATALLIVFHEIPHNRKGAEAKIGVVISERTA